MIHEIFNQSPLTPAERRALVDPLWTSEPLTTEPAIPLSEAEAIEAETNGNIPQSAIDRAAAREKRVREQLSKSALN